MVILVLNVTTQPLYGLGPQQHQKINTSNAELNILSISRTKGWHQERWEWSGTITLHCVVCTIITLHVHIYEIKFENFE